MHIKKRRRRRRNPPRLIVLISSFSACCWCIKDLSKKGKKEKRKIPLVYWLVPPTLITLWLDTEQKRLWRGYKRKLSSFHLPYVIIIISGFERLFFFFFLKPIDDFTFGSHYWNCWWANANAIYTLASSSSIRKERKRKLMLLLLRDDRKRSEFVVTFHRPSSSSSSFSPL